MYLTCSCCGSAFRDTIENTIRNDCDRGFGMCPRCDVWIEEKQRNDNQRLIQQFADKLNETNREKYLSMDYELQMGLVMKAIEDGAVTINYTIGG